MKAMIILALAGMAAAAPACFAMGNRNNLNQNSETAPAEAMNSQTDTSANMINPPNTGTSEGDAGGSTGTTNNMEGNNAATNAAQ